MRIRILCGIAFAPAHAAARAGALGGPAKLISISLHIDRETGPWTIAVILGGVARSSRVSSTSATRSGRCPSVYTEARSSANIWRARPSGFPHHRKYAGIPTGDGRMGGGRSVIAFSRIRRAARSEPGGPASPSLARRGGRHGHGLRHNLLGSRAARATAVKDWLAPQKCRARAHYVARRGGWCGKNFMVRSGAFDDADIASLAPSSFWEVIVTPSLANTRADLIFTGRASHAAASPHLGRSALDAVD